MAGSLIVNAVPVPVQLQQLGEAAATIVRAIDTANRARKLSDAQSSGPTEDCRN